MSARPSRLAAALAAVLLCACSMLSRPGPVALYDFGPAEGEPAPLQVPHSVQVVAPAWIDGTGMTYRLAYADASRVSVYRDSRWAARVPALLQEHLQQRIVRSPQATNGRRLRVEIEEFSQWFSSPDASRAVIRMRVVLIEESTGRSLARQAFAEEVPAHTHDAAGGAHALTDAARRAGARLLAWASMVP